VKEVNKGYTSFDVMDPDAVEIGTFHMMRLCG